MIDGIAVTLRVSSASSDLICSSGTVVMKSASPGRIIAARVEFSGTGIKVMPSSLGRPLMR